MRAMRGNEKKGVNRTEAHSVKEVSRFQQGRLIEQAQKGSADAFAEIFESLRPVMSAVASQLVGPTDADDVVMESYVRAWKAIPRFRQGSSLKTWLYRIARNCAIDHIRKRQRRGEIPLLSEKDDDQRIRDVPDTAQRTAGELVEKKEVATIVREAVAQLGDEHRIALQLRFGNGLSYAEIAAATGVSIGTVMSRLFNGKRKLRKRLEAGNRL